MTMKKFFGMMAAMAMTALTLTSCINEDIETSITLSGDWYGDFGMCYYLRNGDRYDSYDTDISFYPDYDYATHGYGYQVDYYKYGPYERIYHSFHWTVQNQNIILEYCDDNYYDTVIRDYRMSHSTFTGYFGKGSEQFRLSKYSDYYNWNPYWNDYGRDGWGYYWYDDYYYAPTRSTDSASADSLKANKEAEIVGYGNRFSEE